MLAPLLTQCTFAYTLGPVNTRSPRFVARTPHSSCRAASPLDKEEVEALAGIWRTTLNIDSGERMVSLHLLSNGRVDTTAEDATNLGDLNICRGATWSSARWSATTDVQGVRIQLQLGLLHLEGSGARNGLRCSEFKGSVLEGAEEPDCVGGFHMALAMPTVTDVAALERSHQARVEKRPAPPVSFPLSGFVGRWRLLLAMDSDQEGGDSPPACYSILLANDRSFRTEGDTPTLAGSWGLWAPGENGRGSYIGQRGTALWIKVRPRTLWPHPSPPRPPCVVGSTRHIPAPPAPPAASQPPPLTHPRPAPLATSAPHLASQVHRDKCTETFRGIGDLPLRESFRLWGKPLHETVEAELWARTDRGGGSGSDRVVGRLWCGDVEPASFGMFSLLREAGGPASELDA